ncbi:hypothetical protein M5E82_10915 [Parabacteroides distasonis]|nr:hypothetical protein M5E82_10915 [Parabacteroides distasonis]
MVSDEERDCVIFTHNELISKIEISDDFQVTVLYISNSFSFKNIPRNDYDVIGKLTLLRNPIMSLTEREQRIFMEDIELIRRRLTDHTHRFHDELIGCLAKTFVLDLYDFHARIYESPSVSEQNAVLMERFINLLKAGIIETTGKYPITLHGSALRLNTLRKFVRKQADLQQITG